MNADLPSLLYISQDGSAPSGITTYGSHLLAAFADARMLLLNTTRAPLAVPSAVTERVRCAPEAESHDVCAVARHIALVADEMAGDVVILPNTGDTPWSATVEFVRRLGPAARSRVRVLGIVHSDVETQYSGAARHAVFAGAWIGVSRRCAEELRRRLAGVDRPVHELPYPMPVPNNAAVENMTGPLRLVYAGRLEEPQKRVSRLAAVFGALAGRGVRFTAVVAGEGPARSGFEAAVAAGPAAARVTLAGALDRERLAAVLQGSDLFVLTSAYEGMPLALLEAMAAGVCPVVMQMESGIADVLEDNVNALIVPQGDVGAMVDALIAVDRDRGTLGRLKRRARERIAAEFSPERHFARLGEIVDMCGRTGAPNPGDVKADPTADAVARLVRRTREQARHGCVAVYGAGMFGRKVVDALLAAGLPVKALLDSDPARAGTVYRGFACKQPEDIARMPDTVFVVGSLEFAGEIAGRIREIAEASGNTAPVIISSSD